MHLSRPLRQNPSVIFESYSLMSRPHTPNLIEVLCSTMEDVEQTAGLSADNPALLELRTILRRRVSDLQRAMASELSDAASQPIAQQSREDFEWE
jgi:hypothetical protein